MFLGDTRIDETLGELFGEGGKARAVFHGGGYRNDIVVRLGFCNDGLREHARILRCRARTLLHLARRDVIWRNAMELAGVLFGGTVALALLGNHVQKRGAIGLEAHAQRALERGNVVAGDRGRARDAELFEEHFARNDHLFERIFRVAAQIDQAAAKRTACLERALHRIARTRVFAARALFAQITSERAHIARNGHLVVVQNNDHGRLQLAQLIEGLKRHAARKRRVANDGDDFLIAAVQVARHGEAQRHRNGIGGMSGRVNVVFAFACLRKARHAAELAQGVEFAQAARYELVGIRLVPHIEKQLVMRAIEHAVTCQNELDHAKARRHMAARFRRGRNNLLANFRCKYGKLLVGEELQVRGGRNHIENAMALH